MRNTHLTAFLLCALQLSFGHSAFAQNGLDIRNVRIGMTIDEARKAMRAAMPRGEQKDAGEDGISARMVSPDGIETMVVLIGKETRQVFGVCLSIKYHPGDLRAEPAVRGALREKFGIPISQERGDWVFDSWYKTADGREAQQLGCDRYPLDIAPDDYAKSSDDCTFMRRPHYNTSCAYVVRSRVQRAFTVGDTAVVRKFEVQIVHDEAWESDRAAQEKKRKALQERRAKELEEQIRRNSPPKL